MALCWGQMMAPSQHHQQQQQQHPNDERNWLSQKSDHPLQRKVIDHMAYRPRALQMNAHLTNMFKGICAFMNCILTEFSSIMHSSWICKQYCVFCYKLDRKFTLGFFSHVCLIMISSHCSLPCNHTWDLSFS